MKVNNEAKGFTIIEVVLVLAIAGLIFLVVFLALPALQRSQRDSQRKQDLSRFISQLTTYQSNNQGQLPSSATAYTTFISNYLTTGGSSFSDPSTGNTYSVTYATSTPSGTITVDAGQINLYTNTKCDSTTTNGVSANSGDRNFAAVIYQEQGNYYCQDNS